jgi:single-stranded DNA-binding protein
VAVTGTLENQKWTGDDGVSHDSWVLTVNQVSLLADSHSAVKAQVDSAAGGDHGEGVPW